MDNMNNNPGPENAAQATNNAAAGGNGSKADKLFTQEDVNRIVSERLARERERSQPAELTDREKSLMEREAAIAARESRYKCADYLKELNVNEARYGLFLDNLDTANFDSFKKAVDAFADPYIMVTRMEGAFVEHPPVNRSVSNILEKTKAAFAPPKI